MSQPGCDRSVGETMSEKQMRLYGSEKLCPVEVDEEACAHCEFVNRYVRISEPGEVTFVCEGPGSEHIRRVAVAFLLPSGGAGLICERYTEQEVEAEMAEAAIGEA